MHVLGPVEGCERGVAHALPTRPVSLAKILSSSTKLEAYARTKVRAYASVFSYPSPSKALRACPEPFDGERGTKRVRVPP